MTPSSRRLLVDLGGVFPESEPVLLDAAVLHERCQPLVEQTLEKLGQVFEQLSERGIDPNNQRELGAIYLVGGCTAFPPVARRVRRLGGRKTQLAPQAFAATALGLAVAADPDTGIFVREGTTRHFGVWREALSGREQTFDCILSKNRPPDDVGPLVVERWYRPQHTVGHFRFLECSELTREGQPSGDLTPWCEVFFPYDAQLKDEPDLGQPKLYRRIRPGDEIVERYTYASDGSISVDIQNRTRGYGRQVLLGQL
jgi:hypothetical protein